MKWTLDLMGIIMEVGINYNKWDITARVLTTTVSPVTHIGVDGLAHV